MISDRITSFSDAVQLLMDMVAAGAKYRAQKKTEGRKV